ncbi:MAG TPA: phage tail sheath subtilisin-like domain-containing protein [Flavobacteriaceae bacterium]|nr:phage tail sheath subtilisin-like domain-containing protein [Flavobacteriaceae bacterium]MCB9213513.1 phage tail sheath subtilisin-like domain-containing protein [Alteromonas sp.]HQU21553.1 phage tail sheath subtilisin-like domain-containing protein [Flavobacteriaceae bacterium]
MATTYKTPGVYVEEISIFPPSVAQVETAIPAFIGYTKKAKKSNEDLLNVPTKVASVLDFVTYFGGAPEVDITSIELDALKQVSSINLTDKYYLYEAVRMFYANGGGDCYVVSVGSYGETIQNGDGVTTPGFLKGLEAIKKVDEPTLLIAPDAPLMSQTNMNSLYQAMLAQCNELGDRFAIVDTKENTEDHDDAVEDFRNGIGMNYLKYGAVYSPWLKANLPRQVDYSDIKGNINLSGSPVDLADLVADANAKALADDLDDLVEDQAEITAAVNSILSGAYPSLDAQYEGLSSILKGDSSKANLTNLLDFYAEVIDFIRDSLEIGTAGPVSISHSGSADHLLETIQAQLNTSATTGAINDVVQEIIKMEDDSTNLTSALAIASATGIDYDTDPTTATTNYFGTGTSNTEKIAPHVNDIANMWGSLKSAVDYIVATSQSFVDSYEDSAIEAIPALKTIVTAIANEYLTLPPSSTMAGVYARVDNDRGVWKAPANTSLSNVVGVTTLINKKEQEGLNVDVVAGKSVNAIRPFTGKGIMVWGARTLAGNDNEWRYIPVRRFFNMAEESIKKATEQFVFEPNDRNTWVKVRAMIENFLILQWRAGALAGAKPDQAFYVRVGLGETMTADDILNGKMNVEIGMAVVRPAEFIILKFSHKMQES